MGGGGGGADSLPQRARRINFNICRLGRKVETGPLRLKPVQNTITLKHLQVKLLVSNKPAGHLVQWARSSMGNR